MKRVTVIWIVNIEYKSLIAILQITGSRNVSAEITTSTAAYPSPHIYHVDIIVNMDFISPVPCIKMRLHNSLMISIINYCNSSTLPKLRRHASIRSTQKPSAALWASAGSTSSQTPQFSPKDDNKPQTASRCLRAHVSSTTRLPSYRYIGLYPAFIVTPPKRTTTTLLG